MRAFRGYICVVSVQFFVLVSFGQNLVPNPSFEEFNGCPGRLGNFDADVIGWSAPTHGSTDYFNSCSETMGVRDNFNGTQDPEEGEAYAGLYLYAPDDYREYMQTELRRPLVEGEWYTVRLAVSRAERSDYAVDGLGVLLLSQPLKLNITKTLGKRHWLRPGSGNYSRLDLKHTEALGGTEEWVLLEGQFQAKGGERFLLIGNFNTNSRTRVYRTRKKSKMGAYYYLDNIRIQSANPVNVATAGGGKLEVNKVHQFRDVLFDFDKHQLLDSAKSDLQHLYAFLDTNAELRIVIDGHTDNVGTPHYNKNLSDARCKAVADYLVELGLSKERISWQGHGGSKPIADNDTEAGRQKNRRVEFVLVGK